MKQVLGGMAAFRSTEKSLRPLCIAALTALLAGCSLAPSHPIPKVELPKSYRNSQPMTGDEQAQPVPPMDKPTPPPSPSAAPASQSQAPKAPEPSVVAPQPTVAVPPPVAAAAAPAQDDPTPEAQALDAHAGVYPGSLEPQSSPTEQPAPHESSPAQTETTPAPTANGSGGIAPTASTSEEKADPATLPKPASQWWREFGSTELNGLVERALENNHDLKAAVARIAQAEAQAGIQAGSLLPTLGISGKHQADSPIGGTGNKIPSLANHSERLHQIGLTASYELDIWGKNRDAQNAALATAQASLYDREALALTLVADVSTAYFQYLEAVERLSTAEQNVANMVHVLEMVSKRYKIGEGTRIEQRQQATALVQAKALVPGLRITMEQSRNHLATLLGELPENLDLHGKSIEEVSLPTLPAALPSELLARRPDLRRAEAQLVSANSAIGQARAALLPSFSLTGERGVGSPYFDSLINPTSYYFIFTAALSQVLFDNGKSLSQIELQQAIYSEKVETYRQAVLNALSDVENALASQRLTAEAEALQIEASNYAHDAYDLSQKAFVIGTTDYLTILDTERTHYQTEDSKAVARFDRLSAMISLFRALGGGTDLPPVVQEGK